MLRRIVADMAPNAHEMQTAAVGRLERERYSRGYRTIKQFADATGVHRHTLTAIERGESNPTLSTLQRIATALELSPETVLGWILEAEDESDDDHPEVAEEAGAA